MAPPEFHSPFPTSHDTLGTSTLGTPMFMPSSPPRMSRIPQRTSGKPLQSGTSRADATHDANATRRRKQQSHSPPPSRNDGDGETELDHPEYTLDMSKLPGDERMEKDLEPLPEQAEVDELSEPGGPEDFTLNMEKYLRSPMAEGKNSQKASQEINGKLEEVVEGNDKPEEKPPGESAEDAADFGDYSEFEPPLDMSTPAHLLSRKHEMSKDGSRLADIEEQPVDSPTGRKSAASERMSNPGSGRMYVDTKELENLRAELRQKDELLQASQGKLLEAVSAVSQIQHLKTVVQTKDNLLHEANSKIEGEASLKSRMQQLQSQLDHKGPLVEESREEHSEVMSLRRQVQQLQQESGRKDMLLNEQQEGSTALLNLRRENQNLREQLSSKDDVLEENMAKMNDLTAAKQRQILEKDAQIEDLKAVQDEQYLKIERLQANLDSAVHDYDTLEEQMESLEDKSKATERQVRDLQSELSIAQENRDMQYGALRTVAIHHSIEVENKGFMELVEGLKLRATSNATSPAVDTTSKNAGNQEEIHRLERELGDVRLQLQESKSSANILTLKLEHTQELLSESRTFINNIESENGRLVSSVDALTSDLKKTQDNLTSTSQQLDHDRAVINDLRNGNQAQQRSLPTPPPSTSTPSNIDHSTIKEIHQAEITRLQESHASALSSLRDSHAQSTLTLHNLLAASQSRETDLKTELNSLRDTSSSQATQLETLNAEISRLKSAIEDKDAAAAAIDARIASSARKREEKWEARVEMLVKERERMGKALMWSWGENEVGDRSGKISGVSGAKGKGKGEGQGYKYKYTKRASMAGS